jgi:hypothetical protein
MTPEIRLYPEQQRVLDADLGNSPPASFAAYARQALRNPIQPTIWTQQDIWEIVLLQARRTQPYVD